MNSIFPTSILDSLQPPASKSLQLAHHLTESTTMATQFSRRFEQLLRSEKFYDCIFHISGTQLKCHKLILSTASPVFEAMFYGPLREQQKEIEILDISADIFQMLLNFIYVGSIDFETLTLEQAIELYYCSEKYLVADLSNSSLLAIARKLRYSNILPALELCVCMDMHDLLEVCMSFFSRCCLNNPQYMTAHKNHYVHVSKECIKAIITANSMEKNKERSKHLLWFVSEWCQQECHELGLQQKDCALIISDLKLSPSAAECIGDVTESRQLQQTQQQQREQKCNSIERCYFKACRPFIINHDNHECVVFVKCDRFIALRGLIICSRLIPNVSPLTTFYACNLSSEYNENFHIEISTSSAIQLNNDDDRVAVAEPNESIIWQYNVIKKLTRYNCDMNIDWDEGLLLTPDIEYKIKLIWHKDAYGSEYPCSLQSDLVDGIRFRDVAMQCGSLVKGLRFTNFL